MKNDSNEPKIAVVIPCYKVADHILSVLNRIGPEASRIYVVDDCCPSESGKFVENSVRDPRVQVIFRKENGGVGAATLSGYQQAIQDGQDIIVKIDGDGQMDPALIPGFVHLIRNGQADYTKGNRFFDLESVASMPAGRKLGNLALSFFSKASSGYWNIFDPTNGFTAISAPVAKLLPFDKIAGRYFFESDMLFRLNTLGAVVVDIPMRAVYGDEVSGLNAFRVIPLFFKCHLRNFLKRILYNYFLRDFNAASLELIFGLTLTLFGLVFGARHWWLSAQQGQPATAGTVMLSALPTLVGIQLLISFLSYDMNAGAQRQPLIEKIRMRL